MLCPSSSDRRRLGRDLDANAAFAEALRLSPKDAAPRRQLVWRQAMGEGGKDAA